MIKAMNMFHVMRHISSVLWIIRKVRKGREKIKKARQNNFPHLLKYSKLEV